MLEPLLCAEGPTLETERLILRVPVEADEDRYCEMMADEGHARFIGAPMPAATAWRVLMTMIGHWACRGYGMFAMVEKGSGRWVGQVGPWRPRDWPVNEFGWMLAPDAARVGYAEEGAKAALAWTFSNLEWADVVHSIDRGNSPSNRLAKRLGAEPIGPLSVPPPYDDCDIVGWRQTRQEWASRRSRSCSFHQVKASCLPGDRV